MRIGEMIYLVCTPGTVRETVILNKYGTARSSIKKPWSALEECLNANKHAPVEQKAKRIIVLGWKLDVLLIGTCFVNSTGAQFLSATGIPCSLYSVTKAL